MNERRFTGRPAHVRGRPLPALLLAALVPGIAALAACEPIRADVDQPIAFPHDVHADTYKIPCQYCHSSAARSQFAGIPAVETCMGCHRITGRDLPGVQRLAAFHREGRGVPWVRVHDLPDFVQFTHEPHVRGGVDCAECHGNVAEMKVAEQVAPLTMGWCLDCHIAREAPTDCLICHF